MALHNSVLAQKEVTCGPFSKQGKPLMLEKLSEGEPLLKGNVYRVVEAKYTTLCKLSKRGYFKSYLNYNVVCEWVAALCSSREQQLTQVQQLKEANLRQRISVLRFKANELLYKKNSVGAPGATPTMHSQVKRGKYRKGRRREIDITYRQGRRKKRAKEKGTEYGSEEYSEKRDMGL